MDVLGRRFHLLGQMLAAPLDRVVRLVPLEQVNVAFRVIPDAGHQFQLVGQLHDVVVRPQGKRLGLDNRLFLAGEHDHGGLARCRVGPKKLHQRQAVDLRHDQVLQDHGRLGPVGHFQGLGGILAEVEGNVRLVLEHLPHGGPDNRLIVDQQDRNGKLGHPFRAVGRGGIILLAHHRSIRSRELLKARFTWASGGPGG